MYRYEAKTMDESLLIGKFDDESGSSIKWILNEKGEGIRYIFIDDDCVSKKEVNIENFNFDLAKENIKEWIKKHA